MAIPEALYYQGWCLANLARHQEALNAFQRLINTYPGSPLTAEASLKQAECYQELKQPDKAVELYRNFQAKNPNHELLPQAIMGEAWALFKSGKSPEAKALIAKVRQRFPDNTGLGLDALFLLGQIYTEEKDFTQANLTYREITRQRNNPRATDALYLAADAMFNRAEALARDNKTEESRQTYRDALNYFKGIRSKAELIAALTAEIERLLQERLKYASGGALSLWEARIGNLRKLLAQAKERRDLRSLALYRAATCYQALEMPDEASVVYEFLHANYPDDQAAKQIWFGWIQSLTQRGLSEKANAETEKYKAKYGNTTENIDLIQAEAKFGQQDYTSALALYEKARGSTKDPEALAIIEFRMASCQYNLNDFPKARDTFSALAEKYPASKIRPDALFFLALTHTQLAERSTDPKDARSSVEAAIKAYAEIREKFPQYDNLALVTFRLGYMYSFAGAYDRGPDGKLTSTTNFDNAIAAFEEFIQKWPDRKDPDGKVLAPEAMYQIARIQLSAERHDKAIEAYRALLGKYPDHDLAPHAAFEIGTTAGGANKKTEMIEALRAYVQKYPKHSKVTDALYSIAFELESQKRIDEAVIAYRDAINHILTDGALTEDSRGAVIGAQVRINNLLITRNDPATVIADCEQVLAKVAEDALAARAMVSIIADLYRKSPAIRSGVYAKLDEISQKYQQNTAIRHASLIATMEMALTDNDLTRANASVARLLADSDKDKLPLAGYVVIGNVQLKGNKFAQAKEHFDRVIAGAGTDQRLITLAHLGLGQALLGLKDLAGAQTALEKAASDPQHCPRIEVEFALAQVLEANGKIPEAVAKYSQLLAATKGDMSAEIAFRLGNIFFNMVSDPAKVKDNKKMALSYYARLLFSAGPKAEEAIFRAAECHEALGNASLACGSFRGYIQRFPTGRFVEDAKVKVSKLCATTGE